MSGIPQWAEPWQMAAGFLGATVSSLLKWEGPAETVRKLIIGGVSAMFLTPMIGPVIAWALGPLNLPVEGTAGAAGFFAGVTGYVLIETMVKLVKAHLEKLNPEDGDEAHD
jgi:hypothetical protein